MNDDPTLVDLWIDAAVYRVAPEVRAHFRFMSSLITSLANQLSALSTTKQAPPSCVDEQSN